MGAVAVILGGWVWSCYHKGGMQLMHTIFIDQLFIALAAPDSRRVTRPFYYYVWTLAQMPFP